ncbi:integrase [Priestia aryabhattai]|uniref:integrase n=1 Tax=Priestia aryabhattai TaxID=412384 RepID=UPI003B685936
MTHIERWAKEYLTTDKTYENHINKFVSYIGEVNKGDKPTKIHIDDVKGCIGYYKDLGQINTYSSMENHIEGVKAFYKFLVSKAWASDIFNEIYDYRGYKNHIAKKFNLTETQERKYFESSTLKTILDTFDKYLNSNNLNDSSGNRKRKYIKYSVLRIFIKLSLVAPAKRAKICNLKRSDFDVEFRTFRINDVTINLPNSLRRDLAISINEVEEQKNKNIEPEDNLLAFLDNEKFRPENLNTWFCNFIKEFEILNISDSKTTYSVEVLRNSAIVELIEKDVDLALISIISGISISSLEDKYFKVRSYNSEDINRLINQGVAKSSYFVYL